MYCVCFDASAPQKSLVPLFLISQEHLEGISEKANVYVT